MCPSRSLSHISHYCCMCLRPYTSLFDMLMFMTIALPGVELGRFAVPSPPKRLTGAQCPMRYQAELRPVGRRTKRYHADRLLVSETAFCLFSLSNTNRLKCVSQASNALKRWWTCHAQLLLTVKRRWHQGRRKLHCRRVVQGRRRLTKSLRSARESEKTTWFGTITSCRWRF